MKKYRWDTEKKCVVISETHILDMNKVSDLESARHELKQRLKAIVVQVKSLKREAEEIKEILNNLND